MERVHTELGPKEKLSLQGCRGRATQSSTAASGQELILPRANSTVACLPAVSSVNKDKDYIGQASAQDRIPPRSHVVKGITSIWKSCPSLYKQ